MCSTQDNLNLSYVTTSFTDYAALGNFNFDPETVDIFVYKKWYANESSWSRAQKPDHQNDVLQ